MSGQHMVPRFAGLVGGSFYLTCGDTIWLVWGSTPPDGSPFLIAQPMQEHGVWDVAAHTSNSGNTIFVCKTCGRESKMPDKRCPTGPTVDLTNYLVSPLATGEQT